MAGEAGGRAAKLGNEFERLWVVRCALSVLSGDARSIRWEPLGDEGEGVELALTLADGTHQVHQCKTDNPAGRWSITALRGVLGHARRHLADRGASTFVFVSRDRPPELDELAKRARHVDGAQAQFEHHSLASRELQDAWQRLCRTWGTPSEEAFRLVQRIRVEQGIWGLSAKRDLEHLAMTHVDGNGAVIVDAIASCLLDHLGNDVHADTLRAGLQERGLRPSDLRHRGDLPSAIEALRGRFSRSLQPLLIDGELMPRRETAEILTKLAEPGGPRILFVVGDAATGKSGVLLELTQALTSQGVPYLPIRLDGHALDGSLSTYSRDVLELPRAPGVCLATIAGGRPCVLILDQLDAIRWTSSHSGTAWRLALELIEGALGASHQRVVLACRQFDLEDDPQLRAWKAEQANQGHVATITVSSLEPEQLRSFAASRGMPWDELTPKQQQLLANPGNLHLWWSVRQRSGHPLPVLNRTGLMRAFWDLRRRELREREIPDQEIRSTLDTLVTHMDREGRLDAPLSLVDSHTRAIDALKSQSLLIEPRPRVIQFAHQSYFDYLVATLVAREALRGDRSPLEWILATDQSFFRRDQLRQLLWLLRDEDPARYLATLAALLRTPGVRFHLRDLALTFLRVVESPTDDELALLHELLADGAWRADVLEVVLYGNPGWFERLAADGTVSAWLASDDRLVDGLALCATVMRVAAQHPARRRVALLLENAWRDDETWATTFDRHVGLAQGSHVAPAYRWYIRCLRAGQSLDVHRLIYDKEMPARRAVRLLAAMLDAWHDHWRRRPGSQCPDSPLEGQYGGVVTDLDRLIVRAPLASWRILLPRLKRGLRVARRQPGHPLAVAALHRNNNRIGRVLATAGRALLAGRPARLSRLLADLREPRATVLARIATALLEKSDTAQADRAAGWLLRDPRRLTLGWRTRSLSPIRFRSERLVEHVAAHCSNAALARLESALLALHPPQERHSLRERCNAQMHASPWLLRNLYGWAQYRLLSVLPPSRISPRSQAALRLWRAKFTGVKAERSCPRVHVGSVRSPISNRSIARLSDRAWLRLLARQRPSRARMRELRSGDFIEATPAAFASDLEQAGKLAPGRFLLLGARLPDDAPVVYLTALLRVAALTRPESDAGDWQPAPVTAVESFVERFAPRLLADGEPARSLCWLLRQRATEPWSPRMVAHLLNMAAHPDPAPDACLVTTRRSREDDAMDVDTAAINTVRGATVSALMALLFHHPDRLQEMLPTLRTLAEDQHFVVRAAAQGLSLPLYNIDRDLSLDIFLLACAHPDDRCLQGRYTGQGLRCLWRHAPGRVEPLLARMAQSAVNAVARAGACWASVGQLVTGCYAELAARCASGTPAQQQGTIDALVGVAVGHGDEPPGPECARRLVAWYGSPDPASASAAARAFRSDIMKHSWAPMLAVAFAQGGAFEREPHALLRALDAHAGDLAPFAPAIETVVRRMQDEFADQVRDLSRAWAAEAHTVVSIVLRLYQQVHGRMPELATCALDCWDALLHARVRWAREELHRVEA